MFLRILLATILFRLSSCGSDSRHGYQGNDSSKDDYSNIYSQQVQMSLPKRTNLIFILDVACSNREYIIDLLEYTFRKISLMEYRLSAYSTSGTNESIVLFQCRDCLIKSLRSTCEKKFTLSHRILASVNENRHFLSEDHMYIFLIDKIASTEEMLEIKKLSKFRRNIGLYMLSINEQKRLKMQSLHDAVNNIEGNFHRIIKLLPFINSDLDTCSNTTQDYDECNRRCSCVNGKMVNCYRIRREFSTMSLEERIKYTEVHKLITSPGKYYKHYLTRAWIHWYYFDAGIHDADIFLPWHRRFILYQEDTLRLADCRMTQPFWNWALHKDIIWSKRPIYHMWDNVGGFGGNGEPEENDCVTTGPFSANRWKTPNFEIAYCGLQEVCPQTHCLKRKFSGAPYSIEEIKYHTKNLGVDQSLTFKNILNLKWHRQIHKIVGGQMKITFTANTPEFYLHHGMVDAIWDEWQQKGKEYVTAGFPGNKTNLLAFLPLQNRHELLNNSNLCGCGIKVIYEKTYLK